MDLGPLKPVDVRCEDCKLPYPFPLDVVLSDDQWTLICPETNDRGVVLCANCIVRRASHVSTAVIVKMRLVFSDDYGLN